MRVNSKTFQAPTLPLSDWETLSKLFTLSLASVFLIWKMGMRGVVTPLLGGQKDTWHMSKCSAKCLAQKTSTGSQGVGGFHTRPQLASHARHWAPAICHSCHSCARGFTCIIPNALDNPVRQVMLALCCLEAQPRTTRLV